MAARNISFGVFSADRFAERISGLPQLRFFGGFQPLHKFARCVFLTKRFHANKTLTVWRANGSVLALFIELDFVAAQPKQFPKIIERM